MKIKSLLFTLLCTAAASAQVTTDYTTSKIQLLKENAKSQIVFIPLEVGQIHPEGWIRAWSDQAANGITGHLDEYQDVYKHGWKGYGFDALGANPKDGTGWPIEQCSYWLDGAVKLAYMTGNKALIDKVSKRLDIIVDGVLNGGETFIYWKEKDIVHDTFNNWGHGVMGRALIDYYQATHNPRVLQALEKVYKDFYMMMPNFLTTNIDGLMGLMRGATNVDAMTETYLESGNKAILDRLQNYGNNSEIKKYEARLRAVEGREKIGERSLHGVTLYEGLRVPAILGLWTGNEEGYKTATHLHDWAMQYNALPYGMPSCEEWLSGAGGFHSVETCVVPAAMWTYNWLMRLSGDASWADLIESVFFNAGPAPVARDFKTMSYYQQPNRFSETLPTCPPVPGDGDTKFTPFGHYVLCCVGSSNWIIPNYVGNMWQATMDGGLAYMLYGPCTVETRLGDTNIGLKCTTDYPFAERIMVDVSLSEDKQMPLYFHVPSWCKKMEISINGKKQKINASDGMIRIDRAWRNGDRIEINLPMTLKLEEGKEIAYPRDGYFTDNKGETRNKLVDDSICGMPYQYIKHGPLLFALPLNDIDENQVVTGQKFNYALAVKNLKKDVKVQRAAMPKEWNWNFHTSPITLTVKAREFDWHPTQSAPMPKEKVAGEKDATIQLVPYNLTKFRVSMFPVAAQ
ncbi:MAG: glycoside hydrolase family 127 protein [Prevotellaceae bacterium]|nr:glycoside hydrolase family 127 protein [Prevotellaceae bacterium]